jgi:CubicO group peptidase (beta-lactamase class C family)
MRTMPAISRMRWTRMRRTRIFLLAALLLATQSWAAGTQLPDAQPQSVGFSAEGLKKLDEGLRAVVDAKKLAGYATILARHGKVVHTDAYGMKDVESGAKMEMDSIVRIFSMTKPVTGVAMMMLFEEGKWKPEDPIAKYIPEFKNLRVYKETGADGAPVTEAPGHAPTIGELMSHTAGFTYGLFGRSAVDQMYQKQALFASGSLQKFVERLAELPLAYQPGQAWLYSVSVDVQGHLVEKLSGKSLPDFMRERIFEPLGMNDTAFHVPQEKLARLATTYQWNGQQKALVAQPRDPGVSSVPGLPQGGGGLYSTAGDYLKFAQMLLNGGELGGVRLLKAASVERMRTNVLSDELRNGKFGLGQRRMQPGAGFGYDFAVIDDPAKIGSPVGKGTYWWFGIAGTWFWIDPTNDVIFIGMIQRRGGAPDSPNLEDLSRQLTYQALIDPKL